MMHRFAFLYHVVGLVGGGVLLLWGGSASAVQAQVPQTLSYQGLLTDAQGIVVADGTYQLTVSFYETDTGGTALWSETHTTTITGGVFSLLLGSVEPLTLAFDRPYWLGTSVDGEAELAPRAPLTASPYSLNSRATVAVPEAGESLSVRTAEGETAHVLSADGSVWHSGVGTFIGGIVVGDTTITVPDTLTSGSKGGHGVQANLPATGMQSGGTSTGVFGWSITGRGVVGKSETGYGVFGASTENPGVFGISTKSTGVSGFSRESFGVFGGAIDNVGVAGNSTNSTGVEGKSTSGNGVYGTTMGNQAGVRGEATSNGIGVFGKSENGSGVVGTSTNSWAGRFLGDVEVTQKLKLGQADQDEAAARFLVWGADNYVKWRTLPATGGGGDGIWSLVNGTATAAGPVAVNNSLGQTVSVLDDEGVKVVEPDGSTSAGFGRTDLVAGVRIGVFGKAVGPGGLAGVFEGDVEIGGNLLVDGTSHHTGLEVFEGGIEIPLNNGNTARISPTEGWSIKDGNGAFLAHNNPSGNAFFAGTLQAGAKNFKIDHPLDPEAKYLQHVSVESPDMLTIYNGNVVTDGDGVARVMLPAYFEALNGDFRYQLTVVGQFAQAIIAEKIKDNQFVIRTDKPNVEVSWQVTGIRHDPWAERHRVEVEVEKPVEERGRYLHPEVYRWPVQAPPPGR